MVFSRFLLLLTQNTEKNCNVRFYRVNSFWSSVLVGMNGRMKKIKIITTCVCHFICVCMFDQIFNSNSSDLFLSLQTRKTDCLFRVCGQFNPITNDFNNDIEQLIKP